MVSGSSNPMLHQDLKHSQLSAKFETHFGKTGNLLSENLFLPSTPNFHIILMPYVAFTAQSSVMPMPMSVPNWPPVGLALKSLIFFLLNILKTKS
ncbi:hypothetical protein Hanom_Chr09g00864431 [Helianthus anomalus]